MSGRGYPALARIKVRVQAESSCTHAWHSTRVRRTYAHARNSTHARGRHLCSCTELHLRERQAPVLMHKTQVARDSGTFPCTRNSTHQQMEVCTCACACLPLERVELHMHTLAHFSCRPVSNKLRPGSGDGLGVGDP